MKARKPKMGRPPLPKGRVKASTFSIRLSPDEREQIEAAAARNGVSASEWARQVLIGAAEFRPG